MLAPDTDSLSSSEPWRAWKQGGLVLLCLAWIALGLVGHAPWKVEDAKTIVAAWEMVEKQDFLVPRLVGEPDFSYGPLVPQLASLTITVFTPTLAPHDAARIAAGVLLFLTLLFTALAGRELGGKTRYWLPMLILIGCAGLFDRVHMLSPQIGAMAAIALSLYALALAPRRPGLGGVLFGLALIVGMLSYNAHVLIVLLLTALLLPMAHAQWRCGAFGFTIIFAVVLTAISCAAWPALLYQRSPDLFAQWYDAQNIFASWSFSEVSIIENAGWLLRNLLWLAWPAWPLAAWLIWIRMRGFHGGLKTPAVILPMTMILVLLVHFLLIPEIRAIDSLFILVPFALLASEEVDSLPRSGSAGLDWFGILTFGLAAIALWLFWWDAYVNGLSSYAAELFRDAEAGYQPSFRLRGASVSLFLTILWIMLVRPARQSSRRAVLNWAAGMMLIWGMVSTIWMPYLDSRRSYQVVADMLHPYIEVGCLAGQNIGDAQRAIFYYYAHAETRNDVAALAACPLLLVQYDDIRAENVPQIDGYQYLEFSYRYGDDNELYALYRKDAL
ncbi:MAG: hypothetical protein LBS40_02910 [Burkholderiales bacterium]|jgi:4-amino-4-deoxy-L-arabinose transferase-like glycosyltransferase|nr:hypothetical protein [Burkholderiales bacterium]